MITMLNIKERPYGLLLFTAIALSLAFAFPPMTRIDFQDKTMFGVPLTIIVWIIPLLLVSIWLFYLLTNRFLYSMSITRIHIFITVFTTICIAIILYIGINPSQFIIDRHELIGNTIQILFITLVCGQCTYLVNVLLGLFQKK